MKGVKVIVSLILTIGLSLNIAMHCYAVDSNITSTCNMPTIATDDLTDKKSDLVNTYNKYAEKVGDSSLYYEEYYYEFLQAMLNAEFVINDEYAGQKQCEEALKCLIERYSLLNNEGIKPTYPVVLETTTPSCPIEEPFQPTDTPTSPISTEAASEYPPPGSGIIHPMYAKAGDANRDNEVNIIDVTTIQLYLARRISIQKINCAAANVTRTGSVNIMDATSIQKKLAGFNVGW